MNIFEQAVAYEGSASNLARALGLSVSRVINWRTRGRVPDGWESVLRSRYGAAAVPPAKRKRKLAGRGQAVVSGSEGCV